MALPPGATMAVTGIYANTPRQTCKARFSQFVLGRDTFHLGNCCNLNLDHRVYLT